MANWIKVQSAVNLTTVGYLGSLIVDYQMIKKIQFSIQLAYPVYIRVKF